MIKALVLLATWHGPVSSPAVSHWFSSQHNQRGQWCCDQADGHAYEDDYTMNADGSVTLTDGRRIEAWKVLSSRNPTGHPILWSAGDYIYCFAPGALF